MDNPERTDALDADFSVNLAQYYEGWDESHEQSVRDARFEHLKNDGLSGLWLRAESIAALEKLTKMQSFLITKLFEKLGELEGVPRG